MKLKEITAFANAEVKEWSIKLPAILDVSLPNPPKVALVQRKDGFRSGWKTTADAEYFSKSNNIVVWDTDSYLTPAGTLSFDLLRKVIVHELVHAIQAQRYPGAFSTIANNYHAEFAATAISYTLTTPQSVSATERLTALLFDKAPQVGWTSELNSRISYSRDMLLEYLASPPTRDAVSKALTFAGYAAGAAAALHIPSMSQAARDEVLKSVFRGELNDQGALEICASYGHELHASLIRPVSEALIRKAEILDAFREQERTPIDLLS